MEQKLHLMLKIFANQNNWKIDQFTLKINTKNGYEFKGMFLTNQKKKITFNWKNSQ